MVESPVPKKTLKPEIISILFFMILLFNGCSLSPGLYIDNIENQLNLKAKSDLKQLEEEIKIIPVNVTTIKSMLEKENAYYKARKENRDIPPKARKSHEYRIGAYDVLNIIVWEHTELNIVNRSISDNPDKPPKITGHTVDGAGEIYFPYIGTVQVAGLTVGEARRLLTKRLGKYIPEPQLDLNVIEYRSKKAYIVGEVRRSGELPLKDKPVSVLEAVAIMGGLTENADMMNAKLVRAGDAYHINYNAILRGDIETNYVLQDKDMLIFPDNRLNRVFAIGEFLDNQHKTLFIPNSRHLTLADVINSSGGLNLDTVDPQKILIFRFAQYQKNSGDAMSGEKRPLIYHLDSGSAEGMLLATKFHMQPLDVVYVGSKNVVRWNRLIKQLVPSLQMLHYPTQILYDVDNSF